MYDIFILCGEVLEHVHRVTEYTGILNILS